MKSETLDRIILDHNYLSSSLNLCVLFMTLVLNGALWDFCSQVLDYFQEAQIKENIEMIYKKKGECLSDQMQATQKGLASVIYLWSSRNVWIMVRRLERGKKL